MNNHAAQLFILIDQQKKNPVSYTITGKDPLDKNYNLMTSKQITGSSSLKTRSMIVVGKGSPIWSSVNRSWSVYLELNALTSTTEVSITYLVADEVPLINGLRYTLNVEGQSSLKFTSNFTSAEGNHHYKFMIDAFDLTNKTSIEASGWKGSDNHADNKFHFTRYDQGKLGYVMDKTEDQYCKSGTCSYHIQATLSNVKTMELFAGENIGIEDLSTNSNSVRFVDSRLDASKRLVKRRISLLIG